MKQEKSQGLAMAVAAIVVLLISNNAPAARLQIATSQQVEKFLRLARSELASSNTCLKAKEYLGGLPLKQRLSVARAIVNNPNANIGYLGANILITHGYARDTVPALAAILASGRDQTQLNGRFGYDWQHGDDETLFLRMIIRINTYLLANLSKYTGEERKRVEGLLMGGLFESPSEAFSAARAKKLISKWESELKGRR